MSFALIANFPLGYWNELSNTPYKVMIDNSETLIDQNSYAIVIHRNFIPLYMNQAYAKLFGFSDIAEAMEFGSLLRYIDPLEHGQAWQSYRKAMEGNQDPGVRPFKNLDRNGRELWVIAVDFRVIYHEEPAIQVTIIDQTQRVLDAQRLAESEQRFRDIIEGSIQGIHIHSDFRLLFANDAAARIYGYESAEEFLAIESLYECIAPSQRADARRFYEDFLNGSIQQKRLRVPNLKKDGTQIWVELLERKVSWQGKPAIQASVIDVTAQVEMEEELKRRAQTDELTGLRNRAALMELAEQELSIARRYKRPFSMIIMDLDRFKVVNDTYGHVAGDVVLRRFASVCANAVRESDILGRYGGEELIIFLPETMVETARVVAERIREDMAGTPIVHNGYSITCTVSLGLTQFIPGDENLSMIIDRADAALYRAKEAGRNRVAVGYA